MANGMSSGYSPSTTSIATSSSQDYPDMMSHRRKRRGFPSFGDFPLGYPSASGTAIGTAGAAQGTSRSSGNTLTSRGFSHSNAQGESSGYLPSSSSIARSYSGFNAGRRRREVMEVLEAAPMNIMKDQQDTVSVSGSKVTNNPLPSRKIGGDQDMVADEHLDIAETALTTHLKEKMIV
jgi:hypothetical protein